MLFEGAVAATADDPDVPGAQPTAQLRQDAELAITPVNLTAGHHIASPSLADEAGRSGFRQLGIDEAPQGKGVGFVANMQSATQASWPRLAIVQASAMRV